MKSTTKNVRSRRRKLPNMEALESRQLLTCDLGVAPSIVADFDCDNEVGFRDFLLLSDTFGDAVDTPGAGADLDSDGMVGFSDFLLLSEDFGRTANDLTAGLTPEICEDPTMLVSLLGDLQSGGLGSIGLGGDDGPSYGEVNQDQIRRMLLQSPTDGPFYMVNLIEFRDQAEYADGRETELTGREANDLYSPTPFIQAIGGRPVFVGEVDATELGVEGQWDQVAIVEYPCPAALFAMSAHPEFQAASIHKDAGVAASTIMVTHLDPIGDIESPDPSALPFPSTDEDPGFTSVQVVRYNEQAQYPEGSEEPARTGEEAMDVYASSIQEAQQSVGIQPTARFNVEGVFIGDGQDWDEVWIDFVPSNAAFEAYSSVPAVVDAQLHLDAAVEGSYDIVVEDTLISRIPLMTGMSDSGAPDNGGGDVGDTDRTTQLSQHDGYWVGEVDIPGLPISASVINDAYYDSETDRMTVYAQTRVLGSRVVAPPQVGPGECTQLPTGGDACFHPNAVYLNGSGEELMEADGTGQWWVKHSWVVGGEGYENVPLGAAAEYESLFVEGELQDDGSIKIGGLDPMAENYFFNVRDADLATDPPTFTVTTFEPANNDASAGEIDLTPVEQGTLVLQCSAGVSALDGSDRGCPSAQEDPDSHADDDEVNVGYEILQIVSPNEIIVWGDFDDMTQEEFAAIELPAGWFKNQPREGTADSATFAYSPGAAPGEYVDEEHFGHEWRHVATVVEANTPLDDNGLLTLNRISKSHELTFDAETTLSVLISPEDEHYVLVSRDAGRTSDTSTIPDGWQIVEHTLDEELVVQLPNPTLNIRADNEDSFQGPVPELREILSGELAEDTQGDLDNDGEVGFTDFLILSGAFGSTVETAGRGADLDEDGVVGFGDFLILSRNFGNRENDEIGDDHSDDEDRYCELLAVTLAQGTPSAEVWWTNDPTDCTANVWNVDLDQAGEDLGALQVIKNGPRYFVVDNNERLAGGGVLPIQEVAGIQMFRVASVTADPSQAANRTPYQPAVVDRNNVFTYNAGSEVYELTSTEGDVYIMQSYAQIVDPTLTRDDLPGLGSRLDLPEGWTYSSRVLEEPIVLTASEPIEVLQDELQNSYSKLIDGETGGEHSTDCFDDPVIMTAADGTEFVRTPDSCFADLPDWPYEPQYVEIDGLRQGYVDEGPEDGPVVLLLHGQPSWSYLYRDMIPVLAEAGYRVIAMDHLGMGRSDKPVDIERYSYLDHNHRLEQFISKLELTDINLFAQDWGSLIGLRTAGLNTELFATISIGNGSLPTFPEGENVQPPVENPDEIVDIPALYAAIPDQQVPFYDGCERLPLPTGPGGADPGEDFDAFGYWMRYAMTGASFQPSGTLEALTWFDLTPEEEAAYDAPFPSRTYMAGPRVFPSLINDVPGTTEEAWEGLSSFEKPFLTIWASNDPGFQGSCEAQQFLIDSVPGAEGQPHTRIPEASHFLQDDQGEEIATQLVAFYEANGIEGVEAVEEDPTRYIDSMFETTVSDDIVYATVDGQELLLNVVTPEGDTETDRPLVLIANGGAFAFTSRELVIPLAELFAETGYVAAVMSYRTQGGLASGEGFRYAALDATHDMIGAVRFMKANAETFGIDPNKVIVGGLSAGAVMAATVGTTDSDDPVSDELAAYMENFGGVYGNVGDHLDQSPTVHGVYAISGAIFGLDTIDANSAPIYGVHNELDGVAPCGTFGGPDSPISASGTCDFIPAFQEVGVPAESFIVPGDTGHVSFSPAEVQQFTAEALKFFFTHVVDESSTNEPGTEAEILTANLGVIDIPFPQLLANITGVEQQAGDEGMPMVFSVPIDATTLSAEDFAITTASGAITTPTVATLEPAPESDESTTVLLAGPLGSADDLPVSVEIVGSVLSVDGEELQGLTAEITTEGSAMVLALVDPAETNSAGNETTPTRIQLTFNGGVTGPFNAEPGSDELAAFQIIDEEGNSHTPTGFEDLGDNDNYLVLLVPPGVTPASVTVEANTVFSPTNQPNAASSLEVSGTIELNDDEHDLALLGVLDDGLFV